VARALLLDALGTLVELQPPAPRLRALLEAEGFELSEERAAAGFDAEIAYYLEHHLEGGDQASLEDLRDRCATVLLEALALPELDQASARRALVGALAFEPYPEVPAVLQELRAAGMRLVVVSNWDCALPDWLSAAGLLELVNGVVTSAEVGAAKPDRRIFEEALRVAAVTAGEAIHVGDSVEKDVEGARAAGIRPILVARDPSHDLPGAEVVPSLTGLLSLL
jgi:putative hydrolase of the HAD superfamily